MNARQCKRVVNSVAKMSQKVKNPLQALGFYDTIKKKVS